MKKMRRISALALAMLLLFMCIPVHGESEPDAADTAMSVYRGIYGNVEFRLPGIAIRIRDGDMDDAWTDSWQLMGACGEDDAEFQLHMADIALLIKHFRTEYPDEPEENVRYSAMMNYGLFIPNTYGAELADAGSLVIDEKTGNMTAYCTFTYPDMPEEKYIGHFMLSGTKTACLIMRSCPHTGLVADSMKFITDEERDAFAAEREQASFQGLYGLLMTFPGSPEMLGKSSMEALCFFTLDWGMLEVDFLPYSYSVDLSDSALEETLTGLARDKMLPPYDTNELFDAELTRPAGHTAQLDFRFIAGYEEMREYGQAMLGRLYVGEYGIWYVYAPDDQTGRKFLAGIHLADEESSENVSNESAVEQLPVMNGAVTLPLFRERLEGLMNRENVGFDWKPGNFAWSSPVFSGGKWLRTVFCKEESFGVALISLDSSAEDASIREVRMLRYADSEEGKADWQAFSRLCSLALMGETDWQEEHLEPEDTQMVYDRAVLVPKGEIPPLLEDVPYPENESLKDIPGAGTTIKQFEARVRDLTDWELKCYNHSEAARIYLFGGKTGMIVYTDADNEDAAVKSVVVMGMGFEEDAAPSVVYGTMTVYAALADMTPEDYAVVSYILMETPMWDQLCDLWPLLCGEMIRASLMTDERDGGLIPVGFVDGR